MRLLILADALAPHTERWARWFASNGHEVHVASFNSQRLDNYGSADVHVLAPPIAGPGARLRRQIAIQGALGKLIKKVRPNVIHAHSVGGYAWAAMATRFHPFVATPWGTDLLVDIHQSQTNRLLTQRALRSADLVTTDGYHFVPLLRDLGVDPTQIRFLTFGTDTSKFAPSNPKLMRSHLGLPDKPTVISTRTPTPVHDVATFVRAAGSPDLAEYQFIVAGGGPELASLTELAACLGIAERTFFPGMLDESGMHLHLGASDIYVSTSLLDAGLAGSTAEAMAMGLPVIHTANSDNEYWAPDGAGGLSIPNGDSAQLSASIAALGRSPETRRRFGDLNRNKILTEYDTDTQMTIMESWYLELVAAR